jgi:membrane-associated phospholipid phosphatase
MERGLLPALASRGIGGVAALGSLPLPVIVLGAVVTQFGGTGFYFLVLATAYWFGGSLIDGLDRRRATFLLGCALCALALTTTLKGIFALPRPPGADVAQRADELPSLLRPLYGAAVVSDGFGFPSGHATGAALVWGGATLALDVGRRRTRLAFGTLAVLAIGLSRVVIGVHYLVDVLAGFAVGGTALALLLRVNAPEKPGRALSLALLFGLVGTVNGFTFDAMAVLGATLGARIAWGAVGDAALHLPEGRREGLLLTAVGLPLLGGPFGATLALEPGPVAAFLVGAVVVAGVLVLPLAFDAIRESV